MADSQLTGPKGKVLSGFESTPDRSTDNTDDDGALSTMKTAPEARPNTPRNKNAIH